MILTALTATAAFAAVIAASLFAPLIAHFDDSTLSPEARAGIADHFLYLHSSFWPVVGVALLSSVVSAVVLFQRMAAPLVRMVRSFQSIEGGRVPGPIVIRKADYLQEEARALNAMTQSLRGRWSALHASEVRLREAIGELTEHEAELPPSLRSALDALRKSGTELSAQLRDLS
jgi:methyl-accepting chemotaxis protein